MNPKPLKKTYAWAIVDDKGRIAFAIKGTEMAIYKSRERSEESGLLDWERIAKVQIVEVKKPILKY